MEIVAPPLKFNRCTVLVRRTWGQVLHTCFDSFIAHFCRYEIVHPRFVWA